MTISHSGLLFWATLYISGAGTNMKVGAHVWRKAPEICVWSCLSTFLALQVGLQLVVLVSAFVMISTVLSVSCLLFLYIYGEPPVPSHL